MGCGPLRPKTAHLVQMRPDLRLQMQTNPLPPSRWLHRTPMSAFVGMQSVLLPRWEAILCLLVPPDLDR
jgi:hypothetical protein